jgi:hypothetical protein
MSAHRYWRVYVTAANAGGYVSCMELYLRTSIGGANVATGGTASASSVGFGWAASGAFDGSTGGTGWHSGNNTLPTTPEWIQYDLGAGNDKDIVEFAWAARSTYEAEQTPRDFQLQYSDNGTSWTTLYTRTEESGWTPSETRSWSSSTTTPALKEAWRLRTTAQANAVPGVAELAMYTVIGGTNQCTGGTPAASSEYSWPNTAYYGFDANNSTLWDARATSPQWLRYRFASAKNIVQYKITAGAGLNAGDAPTAFTLEYSDGSGGWVVADTRSGLAAWTANEQRTFTFSFPAFSTLQDTFTGAVLDTAKWSPFADAGCAITQSGVLNEALASGTTTGYNTCSTVSAYNLVGDAVSLTWTPPAGTWTAQGVESGFRIGSPTTGGNDCLRLHWTSDGNIWASYFIGGVFTSVASAAYSSVNHKWLRIRETAGTIYWETAPDAGGGPGAWTTLGTVATSTITWSLNGAQLVLFTGRWGGTDAATGPATFDTVNIPPPTRRKLAVFASWTKVCKSMTATADYAVAGCATPDLGQPFTSVVPPVPGGTPPPNPAPAPAPAPAPTPAPAPAPPAFQPYTQRVQGESMSGATALNGSQIAALGLPSGFDGTGIAQQDTTANVVKTAHFTGVPVTGDYVVTWRYFVWGNQQNSVQVDGGAITSYQWPGNGTGYRQMTITVPLTAGSHDIKFISEWGYTYIDWVQLDATSGVAPAPSPAPPPQDSPPPPPPVATGWGTGTINPLVTPVGPTQIINNITYEYKDFLQTGSPPGAAGNPGVGPAYWIDDGEWGAGTLRRGTYAGEFGSTFETAYARGTVLGPNNEVSWRSAWKWPRGIESGVQNQAQEVKAYPSCLFGNKPGIANTWVGPAGKNILLQDGTYSTKFPSGPTPGSFLPLWANGALPTINCSFDYRHNLTPTGQGHLTFDIWLQNTPTQASGFGAPPITHEIMIPLTYWGNYGAYGARGQPYWGDVTIGGHLWHVYFQRVFFGGWTFVVFEPDSPTAIAHPGTLNIAAFINALTTMIAGDGQPFASGSEYLVSVELGVEPVYGVGDVEISNYRLWRP